jgi:hypothetical protein
MGREAETGRVSRQRFVHRSSLWSRYLSNLTSEMGMFSQHLFSVVIFSAAGPDLPFPFDLGKSCVRPASAAQTSRRHNFDGLNRAGCLDGGPLAIIIGENIPEASTASARAFGEPPIRLESMGGRGSAWTVATVTLDILQSKAVACRSQEALWSYFLLRFPKVTKKGSSLRFEVYGLEGAERP